MLASIAVGSAGCGGSAPDPAATHASKDALKGERPLQSGVASDFRLRDQNGRLTGLFDQRGKVVLVTFLYTSCPDVCPITASLLGDVLRALGRTRDDVRVLAVSVDPAGDTPRAVRRFVHDRRLPPEFHYLIGTESELRPVWQAYNLLIEPRNPERISHSAYVLAIDRRGRPRAYYPNSPHEPDLLHDMKALLAEPVPGRVTEQTQPVP